MKHTRKILVALLVLMTILISLAAVAIPASAATNRTIYLKPSSDFLSSDAWFQAWTWGGSSGDAWVTFTDSNYDGILEATIPSDRTGMKILRKGPSHAANSWTSWAETGDISINSTKNCLSNSGWSTSFTWSSVSPSSGFTLTVAGVKELAGAEWDASVVSNDMTLVSGRTYEKTFTGIAAGTYEFKVLANHAWTYSWGNGSANASVKVTQGNSNVIIRFNEETKSITTEVVHVHTGGAATCTAKANCSVCGASYGELASHTPGAAATCTAGQECTVCHAEISPKLGHNLVDVEGKDATCTEPGYTAYNDCSRCDYIEGKEEIKALGHKMVAGTVVAPTFDTDGYTIYTCDNGCGKTENRDVVPALSAVAMIGTKKYETLAEAIAAAENGDTVKLVSNISVNESIEIAADKDITIDLAGCDMTVTDGSLNLNIYGRLTMIDSVGGGVSTFRNHYIRPNGELILDGAILQNVATNTAGYAIYNNGKLTLKSGVARSVNTTNYAISIMPGATATIDGGEVYGRAGIAVEGGTLTVNGGNIRCTEEARSTFHALWLGSGEVIINGGTFEAKEAYNGFAVDATSGMLTINGGTFIGHHNGETLNNCVYLSSGSTAVVEIKGGSFTHGIEGNGNISVSGGTFGQDVSKYCENGKFDCKGNDDGTYSVVAHVHSYDEDVTKPDCVNDGYTTYTCACGHTYVDNNVAALGHSDGTPYYEAIGEEIYFVTPCTKCDYKHEEKVTDPIDVDNEAYLKQVLYAGFDVRLTANIDLTSVILLDGVDVRIDLNGFTINANYNNAEGSVEVILAQNNTNVTIFGNGKMEATGDGMHVQVISSIDGASVVIIDGSYISDGCTAIYATRGGSVEIDGGYYEAKELYNGMRFLLDINEAEDVKGIITVSGGSFVGFNPANHNNDGLDNSNKLTTGLHAINVDGVYTVGEHSYKATVTAPDCVNGGYTTHTCVCGDSYKTDATVALGHSHKAVVTAPTCTEEGYTTYTCHCGDSYTANKVAALGHSYDAVVTAPTFDAKGYTTHTCANCGDSYVDSYVDALVAVAQIGEVKYETVTEAINASVDGDVIKLLAGTVAEEIVISDYINRFGGKSITIEGAANYGTTLTGGLHIGYDDAVSYNGSVTVKGIVFEGKGLTLINLEYASVLDCKFNNVDKNAIYVISDGNTLLTTITGNVVNGAEIGIRVRNALALLIDNNKISNTQHNSITVEQGSAYIANTQPLTITNNTLANWGLNGEGRAIRVALGKVSLVRSGGASVGKNVTIANNTLINENAPEEFIKVTDVDASMDVTVNANIMVGNLPAGNEYIRLEGNGASYVDISNNPSVAENEPHIFEGYWWIGNTNTGVKATGTGIESVELNADGELIINFTDGTNVNLGSLKGEQGEPGASGTPGTPGADGIGIENVEIDAEGNLVITYTDGKSVSLGNIKGDKGDQGETGATGNGIAKVELNADGELIIKFTDGTSVNLGNIKGENGEDGEDGEDGKPGADGKDGIGVEKIEIVNNNLVITYTNGTSVNLGNIKGDKGDQGETGATGNGIAKVELNEDGELIIKFTDGNTINLGSIKGEKGEPGTPGTPGADGRGIENVEIDANGNLVITYTDGETVSLGNIKGDQGEPGATGNGIAKIERDENDNLIITYTNGETVNLGNIKGDKGDQGEAGNGIAKVELNENGELVITYTNGESVNLGNLKGDKGDQGEPGKDGQDANMEIIVICIGIAALCIMTTMVALLTRRGRGAWWILR